MGFQLSPFDNHPDLNKNQILYEIYWEINMVLLCVIFDTMKYSLSIVNMILSDDNML
jgi:hypothetical protein